MELPRAFTSCNPFNKPAQLVRHQRQLITKIKRLQRSPRRRHTERRRRRVNGNLSTVQFHARLWVGNTILQLKIGDKALHKEDTYTQMYGHTYVGMHLCLCVCNCHCNCKHTHLLPLTRCQTSASHSVSNMEQNCKGKQHERGSYWHMYVSNTFCCSYYY